ncbi:MAG: PglD N-terminal domain, partial [Clostridia bacterium]|nr:PglD N-terminal domain [Clostridia bacterium]
MNKNLLILGAVGHGMVVKETAEAMGIFNKTAFLDNNQGKLDNG